MRLTYDPGQRVVSINFAYGWYESSKLCAGTVMRNIDDPDDGVVEVEWDDGDVELEAVGDIVHIGITTDDKTFGTFAPAVKSPTRTLP